MEDNQIIDLYFRRSETAIRETDTKYGNYCYKIAYNILENSQDSEESVNDTYLSAWNLIPPRCPSRFSTFLGKLVRNHAIDRWRSLSARKRGGSNMNLALDELSECISGVPSAEDIYMQKEISACLNHFLMTLPEHERMVFLCRYWYLNPLEEISAKTGFSTGKIKSMLHRTRISLRKQLEKEGYR